MMPTMMSEETIRGNLRYRPDRFGQALSTDNSYSENLSGLKLTAMSEETYTAYLQGDTHTMKKTAWLFGILLLIGLTIFSLNTPPVAAENHIIVTITDDIVANDGECSLREAIAAANSNVPSGFLPGECAAGSATETDVILLDAGESYNLTIQGADEDWGETGDLDILNNPDVEIDIHVKVTGEGTARVNASFLNDRIWHVHSDAHLVLEQVETFGGSSPLGGGLFNDNGRVTLTNTVFALNTAYTGGAIANNGANAVIVANDTEILRNTANTTHGGGVLNQNGASIFLIGSHVYGNQAAEHGGGLANGADESVINISRSTLNDNEAGSCGGAVANWGGGVHVHFGSQILNNSAVQYGGGVCNGSGVVNMIMETVIEGNESSFYGGGISNADLLNITDSVVRNNKAFDNNNDGGFGGGFYTAPGSQTKINRSAILGNTADHSGGAILAQGTLEIYNSTLSGNFAIFGGGLLVWPLADVTVVNATIAANASVGQNGVGLLQAGGQIAIGNSLLDNLGGNCYQSDGTFVSLGHNLSGDDSCLFTEAGDLNDVDPLLAELENGVHQLHPDSPAIDAGDAALCAETSVFYLDQLGQTRPKFNGCDIGAVEWQGFDLYLPVIIR
jgi:CSLREA domain-containing protein